MIIYWWTSGISIHRVPMLKKLTEMGHSIVLITDFGISRDRIELGWTVPALGEIILKTNLPLSEKQKIITAQTDDSVNIVCGLHGCRDAKTVIKCCFQSKRIVGLSSEDWDTRGLKGKIKHLLYKIEGILWDRKIDFILAMGEKGANAYRAAGFSPSKIRRFFYVVDTPHVPTQSPREFQCVNLIFVGSLCTRKAVDILIKSLSRIELDFHLLVVGNGEERNNLERLSRELGVYSKITWQGVAENREIPQLMAQSDILILPSRRDGWGAVVNEALHQGTRVICSSECGAACCLPPNSLVFESENEEALTHALKKSILLGKVTERERAQTIKFAEDNLSPTAAAKLFLEVVAQSRKRAFKKKDLRTSRENPAQCD